MSARYQVVVENVEARSLRGNPLGDPSRRELPLVVPVDHDPSRPVPLVFVLAGFSGVGRMMLQDDPWAEGLVRRVERLAEGGRVGPTIYALPDAFTRYGGSQYLNSPATGNYEDYLWQDLLGAVRARYAIGRIGLAGKSSGGFGALVQGMRHPDLVSAVACHAGDMAFEYSYLPDVPKVVRTLGRHGGLDGFLAHFAASHKMREHRLIEAMNIVAMASCYTPDSSAPLGFSLPFDPSTGALHHALWERWLAWDPVRMIDEPENVAALRGLRGLFIDAGTRDEYALDIGARIFTARLRALGVPHQHEEFDDGHMGINYRYDVSLPFLWDALRDDGVSA